MDDIGRWTKPFVQWIEANKWMVVDSYNYVTDELQIIIVPTGFVTDGVSTPRGLWSIMPSSGRYFPAGVVHDYLYSDHSHGMDRRQCDRILWEACMRLKDDKLTADLIYDAVRIYGGDHW